MSAITESLIINQPAGKRYLVVELHQHLEWNGGAANGIFADHVYPENRYQRSMVIGGRRCMLIIEKAEEGEQG